MQHASFQELPQKALDDIGSYGARLGRVDNVSDEHFFEAALAVMAEFGVSDEDHPSWGDAFDYFLCGFEYGQAGC